MRFDKRLILLDPHDRETSFPRADDRFGGSG